MIPLFRVAVGSDRIIALLIRATRSRGTEPMCGFIPGAYMLWESRCLRARCSRGLPKHVVPPNISLPTRGHFADADVERAPRRPIGTRFYGVGKHINSSNQVHVKGSRHFDCSPAALQAATSMFSLLLARLNVDLAANYNPELFF